MDHSNDDHSHDDAHDDHAHDDHSPHEHGHHTGEHDHPQTFDEVIARGFPLKEREELAKLQESRKRRHAARRSMGEAAGAEPERLVRATADEVVASRQDQAALPSAERVAFQNAIIQLVEEGTYRTLIEHHMEMSHNMHGSMGEVGLYRFLAWHRRYLLAMEQELQRVDAVLRPTASTPLGIPYWRWQDPFPDWLNGFLPAPDPVSGEAPPARKNAPPPNKANATDVDIIVNQFAIQDTGLPGENDYTKFTYGLEGWGRRPDGTRLPAHNHGHA